MFATGHSSDDNRKDLKLQRSLIPTKPSKARATGKTLQRLSHAALLFKSVDNKKELHM